MIAGMTVLPAQLPDSPCGVRLACLFGCYQPFPFARFWADEEGRAACLMDGTLTLAMPTVTEEWRLFAGMLPDVRTVVAENDAGKALATAWGGRTVVCPILKATALPNVTALPLPPRKAYGLMQTVFGEELPPFDDWYGDVNHRIRRDRCHIVGVMDGEAAVCTAMTVAESDAGAVIGGVVTHPAYRRRGLAGTAVAALGGLFGARSVFILPKNADAERLYRKLGFERTGDYFQIER